MNTTQLAPYLNFNGNCEEAMRFYQSVLGGELQISRFSDFSSPDMPVADDDKNKVMHATFRVGGSVLMASDGCEEGAKFEGFSLSLAVPTESEANRAFAALSAGGKVTMPLTKTFWSPCFGMLTDRFGVGWMVTVAP